MTTPEGRIKAKVDKMLKELEVWFYSPQAGIYGKSGIPDRVAIVNGLFIGIECKASAKQKPTDLQMATMMAITRAGGKCFVVCDDDTLKYLRSYIEAKRTREGMKL